MAIYNVLGINTYLHVSIRSGGILEEAKTPFLPSLFPRIAAAIFVILLIGSISLVCVGVVVMFGPMLTHGDNVVHADGKIIQVGPDKNFVLETATGQRLDFECDNQCKASLGHLQRHLREHAHTDVYYVQGPNRILMVLDVD